MAEATHIASDRESRRLALARRLVTQRQQRRDLFGPHATAFQEPAWDLLLTAFIAARERRPLTRTAATIQTGVAPTLGSRWMNHLAADGLAEQASGEGAEAGHFSLSEQGRRLMEDYLDLLLADREH